MDFKVLINLLFYADKWNIGFVKQSITDLLYRKDLLEISWLQEENADQSADPFVLVIKDITYVYYEFLNFWQGIGKIYRIHNFDFSTRERVNVSDKAKKIHTSYPYIFKDNDKIYCIPETGEANEATLYDIDPENTSRLTKNKTLISGAPYLDSSLIKFNGTYWLFTSRMDKPGVVYIFHATSLQSDFMPHALNPIVTNRRSFRGAGNLFIDQGILYRPTQNLEKTYGGSIVINKIRELTGETFESECLFEILPRGPYNKGIHTISFEDNLIVIDGKRDLFSPVMFIKKINKRVKYLVRKFVR